ncbi:hypothetical protein PYCCODRAFT_1402589 [Trametes coccinea BRFM310]|uniref:DNA repair protein RAD50 n=1 Tax=Trametes coccinea (strain BRFM310) TaxID=1353009 RepID=A0A1Y2J198_TRAC3|nr:hypothetical protein PYCCODRAFT_1402589 [Trametes coccinea BRFM310]
MEGESSTRTDPPTAYLNKLAIRGIRSFDDKGTAVIEFFSPVTVIVGHNGSGKTTIIECLKYVTTGDQPPNTRGGAFIHDPKMANEKEVKAQVKLRFFAANRTRMLAIRNLSVTMKKNGALTMKTLESILAVSEGNNEHIGKRGVISTKCAEMDAEMPRLLGVSKAVLENVIFCHQEDSYWPLSEPSTLKKKFDDIFEATKYTKALDNIKALRKERMADLKAESERLESLAREKAHADKLKARINEMNTLIASLTAEYDEVRAAYEQQVRANQRLNDTGSKFREIYVKVDQLNQRKEQYKEELSLARENLQEIPGTDDELNERLRTHDANVIKQRQRRTVEEGRLLDIEEDIAEARAQHVKLVNLQGQLLADEKAQEQRITERGELIRDLASRFHIRGYENPPFDREQVVQFISTLSEAKRRQNTETDRLQAESRAQNEEYNLKSRQLHTELEGHRQERRNLRDRVSALQTKISDAERDVDAARLLTSRLAELNADIEEKRRRLDKAREDLRVANFEEKIAEKNAKSRNLDLQRDELNAELRTLSLQADSRAKLDLHRAQVRAKESEIKTTLEVCNPKFRKLVGVDARAETMEQELDRAALEKEREQAELEARTSTASKSLQAAQTSLASLKAQAKAKQDEIKSLDRQLQDGLKEAECDGTVDDAIDTASKEIGVRNEELGKSAGSHDVYRRLLQAGKSSKCCPLCVRKMNTGELEKFEKTVTEAMQKSTPEAIKSLQQELQDWEAELRRLQELAVLAASKYKLEKDELPALKREISEKEAEIPNLTTEADEASAQLSEVTKDLKEIAALQQHAASVSKTQKEIARLKQEIAALESDLLATGSTKTADGVQEELDRISAEIRSNEREKQNLLADRDRQNAALRSLETELHRLELEESECRNQLRDKDELERRIAEMKSEIAAATVRLKELDGKIADAQAPIEKLEQEHKELERELNTKIAQAQKLSQELNMSADKLESMNKAIERYVKEKRGRQLQEVTAQIEQQEEKVQELAVQLENMRATISEIDKEINEAGMTMANLRENIRVRRLMRELAHTQEELDAIDMEEAAKAKRIWTEKWNVEKQKETDLQTKYSHIGGELSSYKSQLKTLENDARDFKDVNKKYRDQLIKVKMSDMANNDLEKYAKALDNAIMKYHSLKMEEVNDTMRHLWNKTYQGTDIDGIKICSDNEGGGTKRTYNYRVVMTKDQVEMDMRGRCSAGQKMLASIIIRLALADSFGQNCGILALDEPTNALDTENIDALAASLVDIIEERRQRKNFQLIVITHDENFLAKLGQSNVIESYWRVSRDSRQKSVIERHRFG